MRRLRLRRVVRHVALIALLIPMLLPIVVMISTSLHGFDDLFSWPPDLIPDSIAWSNYAEIWTGAYSFGQAYKNSIIIGVGTAVVSLVVGTPMAYVTSRYVFRGRLLMLFAVLGIQMISPVVFVVPLYQIMRLYGLLDTYISVIIANAAFATPLVVWLLHGYFQSIPYLLEEAALVDGCSRPRAVVSVVLPLSTPGLVTAGMYAFVLGWNDLMMSLSFLLDTSRYPIPLALYNFSAENRPFWNLMMTASVVAVVPSALIFTFLQRYIVTSLTAGSVKA